MLDEQVPYLRDSDLAPHEAGDRRAQVGRGARRGGRRHLAAEHREPQLLERAAGVEAELVGESLAEPVVGGQGLGLPSGGREGTDQQGGAGLAQRVLGDEGLEVGDDRSAAEGQLGLEATFSGQQVQLLPPGDDRRREGHVAEVGERVAAPQPQRGRVRLGGAGGITGA